MSNVPLLERSNVIKNSWSHVFSRRCDIEPDDVRSSSQRHFVSIPPPLNIIEKRIKRVVASRDANPPRSQKCRTNKTLPRVKKRIYPIDFAQWTASPSFSMRSRHNRPRRVTHTKYPLPMDIDVGVTLDEFWRIYVTDRSKGLLADAADSDSDVRELRLRQFASYTTTIVPEADRKAIQRGRIYAPVE